MAEACLHSEVRTTNGAGWWCVECNAEFAPVSDFEQQTEIQLATLAWVIDRIAKMNGVSDGDVDQQIVAATGGPAAGAPAGEAETTVPEHRHQYGADFTTCVVPGCNHSPYLGSGSDG